MADFTVTLSFSLSPERSDLRFVHDLMQSLVAGDSPFEGSLNYEIIRDDGAASAGAIAVFVADPQP